MAGFRLNLKGPIFAKGFRAAHPDVLTDVGHFLVGLVMDSFTEQGRVTKWPERANPNWVGIIEDCNAGGRVKARRFTSRPAGIDTGVLRNSFTFDATPRRVALYSAVPYSKKFARGGKSVIKFSPRFRKTFYKAMKRDPRLRPLAWLFGVQKRDNQITITVPPRPLLELKPEDEDVIAELLLRDF